MLKPISVFACIIRIDTFCHIWCTSKFPYMQLQPCAMAFGIFTWAHHHDNPAGSLQPELFMASDTPASWLSQETLESLSSQNLREIHPDLHQWQQILSYLLSENSRIHIVTGGPVSYQDKMQYYMKEQDLVLLPYSEGTRISMSKHDIWSCGRTDLLPLQKGILKMRKRKVWAISAWGLYLTCTEILNVEKEVNNSL